MAANPWIVPPETKLKIADNTVDLDTDAMNMALFLSTWTPGPLYSTTGEHLTANGYTQGGQPIVQTLTRVSEIVTFDCTDEVWTAAGGSISARYAAIYVTTAGVGKVNSIIAHSLLDNTPADVTVTAGNNFTVAIHTSGAFTLV